MSLVRLCVSLLFLLCTGCGYHYGETSLATTYQTVSVPFVEGDPNGELTAAIIREVATSLSLRYRAEGGGLLIAVKVIDLDDENIGFRYTYKREGKRTDVTEPVESRLKMVAEVSLIDAITGCVLFPPVRLVASIDLDHDYNYCVWKKNVTQFSLGQLTDADAAFESATTPLNRIMAQKIAFYINAL